MKIEDFIHRRHRQNHLVIASTAASAITSPNSSSSSPGTTSNKRSSSVSAINAPSSKKSYKNETICSAKMSNENNSIISATTAIPIIKNGLNCSTTTTTPIISTSSVATLSSFNNSSSSSPSSLSSSSLIAVSSATTTTGGSSLSSSSGANIVAAVTDSRIHVSRANPIHSNSSNQQHHYHHNNNGTTISTSGSTATTMISSRHGSISAITRIKAEPVENNGGLDFSGCKKGGGGGVGGEVVGRIQTSSSSTSSMAAAGTASGDSSRSGIGGRLQFFKDGKFILELARAKEGEKSGWISVPRKQFRSPSATSSTITPTYPKNESSTSLSFSDDNSSIQSSPWQRDHCWKQSTPRRGISKEMCFYFKRTQQTLVSLDGLKSARIKRRRPLDNSLCETPFRLVKNGCSIAADIVDIKIKEEKEDLDTKIKVEKEEEIDDKTDDDDGDENTAMEEEKSSDDSSTEKEGSLREASKTPTPESQSCDTVDASSSPPPTTKIKTESLETQNHQQTTKNIQRIMNGEKRLKSRAKLTTIIQKLLDRLPTSLYHLSKTQIIGGTANASQHPHSHHQVHSSHQMPSTSSRLASDLHYHQQHVSPRKRILREFEKVSLEDSPAANSKRSRAKGNTPTSGTLPITPIPTGRGVALPSSTINNYVTNGNRIEPMASANNNSNITPNNTPTRLYSSYSIHSLLSGNSNSNSNHTTNNNSRTKLEHAGNNQGGYNDPSYLRAMLASPKSPEGCTNIKSSPYSSSTSGSAKKRSPPYSPLSEIHHHHQSRNRSPNMDYGNMRSPPEAHSNRTYGHSATSSSSRLTPPQGYLSSPKNSNCSNTGDGYKVKSENLINSSPNHHFFSPYMMSPKYVPPPSAMSPNNAGDTYHPKLKGARSPSSQNLRGGIFRTQSPHATTNHSGVPRETSPIGMQSSPSPGGVGSGGGMTSSSSTSTPRTVPKKTVSIRRQFASPSSSSPSPGLSEHLKNAGNSNSKGEERTAMSADNRRTPTQDSAAAAAAVAVSKYHQQANAAAAAAAAAMMQRSSPIGGGGASSLYYMYPPPNGSPSPHHSSSSPSPSPSSSYIPQLNPYYHPYVSTLAALRNPLWMHHYPAAAAAAAAAAGAAAVMMPSSAAGPVQQQGVPFFPYNGAAATTPSHLHHSSYAPMHLAAAGHLGLQPPPPPASNNRSPSTTDDRISTSSIKEEHSSDVPLNLSKH